MRPLSRWITTSAAAIGTIGSAATAAAQALPAVSSAVISLSVAPASGKADVVLGVDGQVALKHFTLKSPDRIVVDLSGASLGLPPGASYDGATRGSVTNVRYSQFEKNVVRVVLTLDGERIDTATREGNQVFKFDLKAGKIFLAAGSGKKGYTGNGGPALNMSHVAARQEVRALLQVIGIAASA